MPKKKIIAQRAENSKKIFNRKLSYLEWGMGNPQKVLALHGWLDNAATFSELAPLLDAKLHLVAIDLPGHGHSDHLPEGSAYHLVDYVATVIEFMDKLKWNHCAWLGHSMGAAIAAMAAVMSPDRVSSLSLIETLGPLSGTVEETTDSLQGYLKDIRALRLKEKPVYPTLELALKSRLIATPMAETGARQIVERGLKKVKGGVTWRSDPRLRLRSPIRMTEEQVLAMLAAIAAPTLLIRGKQGLFRQDFRWLNRLKVMFDLDYEDIEGGHHLHCDAPETVAKLLLPFIRTH